MFKPRALLVASWSLAWVMGVSAWAASGTWGVDSDGNWSDTANWVSNLEADGANNTAFFTHNISATRTVALDSNRTIGNLTFSDGGVNSGAWELNSGVNTLTLDNGGTSTVTNVTGVRINATLGGDDNVVFNMSTSLRLYGTNTYTGTTTLNSYELLLGANAPDGAPGAFGNATTAVVLNAGNFVGIRFAENNLTIGRDIHVTSNMTGSPALYTLPGITGSVISGDVQLDKTTVVGGVSFTGKITGVGGMNNNQSGPLSLHNTANDFTGSFTASRRTNLYGDAPNGAPGTLGNATTAVVLGNSGELYVKGPYTVGRPVISAGTSYTSIGNDFDAAGSFEFSGDVAINAGSNLYLNQYTTGTYSGDISGPGHLWTTRGGTAILTGNNSYDGTTTVNDSGGTLIAASNTALGSAVGGTLVKSNQKLGFQGNLNYTTPEAVTLQNNTQLNNISGSTVFAGSLTLTGSVTMGGSGTSFTINGPILGVGQTLTKSGLTALIANNTVEPTVTVTNGSFGGSATLSGNLTFTGGGAGNLTPGSSTGILSVAGNLSLASNTNLIAELAGSLPGAEHDQIIVGGNVALGSALLSIQPIFSPIYDNELVFLVLNNGTNAVSGTFSGLPQGATVNLQYKGNPASAKISYLGDSGSNAISGGNDIVLYDFQGLPEPTSLGLMALASLALTMRRRSIR